MARFFVLSGFLLLLFSCEPNPDDVLERAKERIEESDYVSYRYFSLWPDMIGENDTIAGTSQFKKNESIYFDYDFISQRDNKYTVTFFGDEYKVIIHEDSSVMVYSEKDLEKRHIKDNMATFYSPIMLLKTGEWEYKKDTAILDKLLFDYFIVETDTLINDKDINVENHIFINPRSAAMEGYERRVYHNGKQFITYTFSDYEFQYDSLEFTYSYPSHYVSKMASEKEVLHLLCILILWTVGRIW